MRTKGSLLKNTIIYSVGNLGSKFLMFALVPIFSFYLTKNQLGHYDLLLTTVNLMVPLVSLQLSEAIYRWLISAGNQEDKKKIVTTGFISVLLLLSLICVFYFIMVYFIPFKYSIYYIGILFCYTIFPFAQQISRGMGRNKVYAIGGIINAVLLLALNLFFLVYLKWQLEGLFISTILAFALSIIYIVYKSEMFSYINVKNFSKSHLKDMINYSWPLIPNSVGWWLINAANKYIVLIFMGVSANGIFAISSRFPTMLTIFNSIFILAWQDQILHGADEAKEKTKFEDKIFKKYVKFEFACVYVLISSSYLLTYYIVDRQYLDSWHYMPFLFVSTAFSTFSAFLGTYYLRLKRTKLIFFTTLLGGVINVVFSMLTIKWLGLYAPAIGTLIGFMTVFIIRYYDLKKEIGIITSHGYYLIFFITSLIFSCFILQFTSAVYYNLAIVVSIILFFILNRELLHNIYRSIIKKV